MKLTGLHLLLTYGCPIEARRFLRKRFPGSLNPDQMNGVFGGVT